MADYKEYIVRVYPNYTEYGKIVDGGKFQNHREDGPAVEFANGDKWWYLNGEHHREDGPAVEYANGDKCWYLNGKLHREDGPAIEDAYGNKSWYLNGTNYSETDFKLEMQKKQPTCDGKVVESTKLIAKIENLCLEIDGKKYKLSAV